MEQLDFFNEEKICAFTGHRKLESDFCAEALFEAIRNLVDEGVYTFLNGMAMGFDLLAAEFVLTLKTQNPKIKLIACIPCENQDRYYDEDSKMRYKSALLMANEQVVLSERYYNGCMQVRNKYMAERANLLVTYCKKTTGGTAYTVKCFQRAHPNGKIIFL